MLMGLDDIYSCIGGYSLDKRFDTSESWHKAERMLCETVGRVVTCPI